MTGKISDITDHVHAADGTRLFSRRVRVESPRAGLLIAHGLGEHSGRYARLAEGLAAMGIAVFSFDHRGHGQSDGKRGHVRHFSQYTDDLDQMIDRSRHALPEGAPLFLLGHSMGGVIALVYAAEHGDKIEGMVVSSPGLAPTAPPSVLRLALVRLMSAVFPSLSFDNNLDPQVLSHDPNTVNAYIEDPLVHRRISARWVTSFLSAGKTALEDAPRIKTPILMQVAGDDRIVSPEASRRFFKQLGSPDKTLRVYKYLFHEIYNEKKQYRKQVVRDLESWIKDHVQ